MKKKLTKLEFIERANKIHKDKYFYYPEVDDYVNFLTPLIIGCLKCKKDFKQRPGDHLQGKGCPFCGGSKKLTKSEFIERSRKIHKGKYFYYPEVDDYKSAHVKVEIKCLKCNNVFKQSPQHHLNGCGCPFCGGSKKLTKLEFIERSKKIHKGKYFYYPEVDDYKNVGTKLTIKCLKCDKNFKQRPHDHLHKYGCPFCGGSKKLTKSEFIEKARKIHKDKYFYYPKADDYKNSQVKLTIKCLKCDKDFKQRPNDHLQGQGCPSCIHSKGADKIAQFLKVNFIRYEVEYSFKNCKNKRVLPFDFYLPDHNICIEFDGEQHFKSVDFFGGKKAFYRRQENDKIKDKFCLKEEIQLIRILYNQINDVEDILKELLFE